MKKLVSILILLSCFFCVFTTQAVGTEPLRENTSITDAREFLINSGIDKLLFVKRYTFQSSHFYTDFIDGCVNFGGNLCVLDLNTGKVEELVPSMRHGIFGRYDLSFDAKKIVFGWKEKIGKGFRIYEVGIDGKSLRQITFDPPDEQERIKKYHNLDWGRKAELYHHHTDDMHPCYLPDGGICFTSTRCEYDILCDGGILTTAVLYRVDADGENMEKLTNSAVSEFSPSMMGDGRILYTRWEYVDKCSLFVKALWAVHPDGTQSTEIFGNDHQLPPCFLHGREIPDKKNMFVCLGTPHFPQGGVGTVIRIDTNYDIRTREPMTYITQDVDIRGGVSGGEGGWDFWNGSEWVPDRNGTSGRLYMDPFPLSESRYMVSCKYEPKKEWDDTKAWQIYLINDTGEHALIYEDKDISCWQPMPLRPRKKPPVLPAMRNEELARRNQAECIVTDIYRGMENVKRGSIKYIRINEQVPRPWVTNYITDNFTVARGTHMGLKVQHGIVPVEEDGSAYFVVPSDKNIFFQALDENFMEVQRERTYVNYRPGERRSCVGCHEKPKDTPSNIQNSNTLMALKKPPSRPGPQPGELSGARVLHYPADVQPILDKHCIGCHGGDEPAASLNLTSEMTEHYCVSYENLISRRRGLMNNIDEDTVRNEGFVPYKTPYTYGSHASKLVKMIMDGHQDVKLSQEEFIRLVTWVDSNAQYHGSYYGIKNLDARDHPDFRRVPTFAEATDTKPPYPEKNE
ncbi:MAG: HzsA-related protein [Planctomycetota bacterium]|jgi:hypothetical protein